MPEDTKTTTTPPDSLAQPQSAADAARAELADARAKAAEWHEAADRSATSRYSERGGALDEATRDARAARAHAEEAQQQAARERQAADELAREAKQYEDEIGTDLRLDDGRRPARHRDESSQARRRRGQAGRARRASRERVDRAGRRARPARDRTDRSDERHLGPGRDRDCGEPHGHRRRRTPEEGGAPRHRRRVGSRRREVRRRRRHGQRRDLPRTCR